jgi:hypothetical protein
MKVQAQNLQPGMRIQSSAIVQDIVSVVTTIATRTKVTFRGNIVTTVDRTHEFNVIEPTAWNMQQCHARLDGCGGKPDPNPWAMDRIELCGYLSRETPWTGDPNSDADKPTEHFRLLVIEGMNTGEIPGLDLWQQAVAETFKPKETIMTLNEEQKILARRGARCYDSSVPVEVIPGDARPNLTGRIADPLNRIPESRLVTVGMEWIEEEEIEEQAKIYGRTEVLTCQS